MITRSILNGTGGASLLDTGGRIFLAILVMVGVLVPLLNLFTAPGSLFHVPTFMVALLGKYVRMRCKNPEQFDARVACASDNTYFFHFHQ